MASLARGHRLIRAIVSSKPKNVTFALQIEPNHTVSIPNNLTAGGNFSFPYAIPYGTSQSCDIFGPLCQPGFVTLSSTGSDRLLSPTTVPCSSYLSLQKSYINGIARDEVTAQVPDWDTIFCRSPECWSFGEIHESLNSPSFTWTYSQCEGKESIYNVDLADSSRGLRLPAAFPPRVVRGKEIITKLPCCGGCAIEAADIRLYYFRDQGASEYCSSRTRQVVVPSDVLNGTVHASNELGGLASLAIVNGQTL